MLFSAGISPEECGQGLNLHKGHVKICKADYLGFQTVTLNSFCKRLKNGQPPKTTIV